MRTFPYDCILIYGPTASGKTTLSLRLVGFLFEKFGLESEIINADSVQAYDELKILTNFPSKEELNFVPSHLFGTLSPNEDGNVNSWFEKTTQIIYTLKSKKIPIVCGGTGLYIYTLINGISQIPPIPKIAREKIKEYFTKVGREKFFNELTKLDPLHNICINDTQRLLRAFEVIKFTKQPLSYWWKGNKKLTAKYLVITLSPPKDKLKNIAHLRIQKMLKKGAIEEVSSFNKIFEAYKGPLTKVIGYEEITAFLKNEISKDQMIELLNIHTDQYIKKQFTWANGKLKDAHDFDFFGDEPSCISAFCDIINTGM